MIRMFRQQYLSHQSSTVWKTTSSTINILHQRCATTAVDSKQNPTHLRAQWPKPTFNVAKMTELLDHDNHEMRKEFRKFLSDPLMKPKYNIPLEEEREV